MKYILFNTMTKRASCLAEGGRKNKNEPKEAPELNCEHVCEYSYVPSSPGLSSSPPGLRVLY